jgi:FMN phosphatase YigB (HAD superfamily)
MNLSQQYLKREFGVDKREVLHTAQALHHDMMPAKSMGVSAAWIDREREDEKCAQMEDPIKSE